MRASRFLFLDVIFQKEEVVFAPGGRGESGEEGREHQSATEFPMRVTEERDGRYDIATYGTDGRTFAGEPRSAGSGSHGKRSIHTRLSFCTDVMVLVNCDEPSSST